MINSYNDKCHKCHWTAHLIRATIKIIFYCFVCANWKSIVKRFKSCTTLFRRTIPLAASQLASSTHNTIKLIGEEFDLQSRISNALSNTPFEVSLRSSWSRQRTVQWLRLIGWGRWTMCIWTTTIDKTLAGAWKTCHVTMCIDEYSHWVDDDEPVYTFSVVIVAVKFALCFCCCCRRRLAHTLFAGVWI